MGWQFKSRTIAGATAATALLFLHGVATTTSPTGDLTDDLVRRLPTKVERLSGSAIQQVVFQEQETIVNDLRAPKGEVILGTAEVEEGTPAASGLEMELEVSESEMVKGESITNGLRTPWRKNNMMGATVFETEPTVEAPVDPEPVVEAPNQRDYVEPTDHEFLGSVPNYQVGVTTGVAQKANEHIEYGKSLARRGASFAARQEFYYALQLVAQAMDSQVEGTYFKQSLNTALTALKEAEEFQAGDTESLIGMRVEVIVENHLSRVVTMEECVSMTPIQLMQAYYRFAENHFAFAGGKNAVSSEAFYSLGKLHSLLADSEGQSQKLDIAKAMVYHRAALACDHTNFRSANELGALMARNGQLRIAKQLLKQSLLAKRTPSAWKNLSIVHRRLGESREAMKANNEFLLSSATPIVNPENSQIVWVQPDYFNKTSPPQEFDRSQNQNSEQALPPMPPRQAELPDEGNSSKLRDRIKKLF